MDHDEIQKVLHAPDPSGSEQMLQKIAKAMNRDRPGLLPMASARKAFAAIKALSEECSDEVQPGPLEMASDALEHINADVDKVRKNYVDSSGPYAPQSDFEVYWFFWYEEAEKVRVLEKLEQPIESDLVLLKLMRILVTYAREYADEMWPGKNEYADEHKVVSVQYYMRRYERRESSLDQAPGPFKARRTD